MVALLQVEDIDLRTLAGVQHGKHDGEISFMNTWKLTGYCATWFHYAGNSVVWFTSDLCTSWTKIRGSWSLFLGMLSQQKGVVFLYLKEFDSDLLAV